MIAKKGNVRLTLVNDAEAAAFRKEGFDILDDDGELLHHAAGKTISWEEHERLIAEAVEAALVGSESSDGESKTGSRRKKAETPQQ